MSLNFPICTQPIDHQLRDHLIEQRKKQWSPEKFDYASIAKLIQDYPEGLRILRDIMLFFTKADGLVASNATKSFAEETGLYWAKVNLYFQGYMECVHEQTYGNIALALFGSLKELEDHFEKSKERPAFAAKIQWLEKYMDPTIPFQIRLLAFMCAEKIGFASGFYSVFAFTFIPAIFVSNQEIMADEHMHAETAAILIRHLKGEGIWVLSTEEEEDIIKAAVKVEEEYIKDILGSTPTIIKGNAIRPKEALAYVHHMANEVYKGVGHSEYLYTNTKIPTCMTVAGAPVDTAMFERLPAEYNNAPDENSDSSEDSF